METRGEIKVGIVGLGDMGQLYVKYISQVFHVHVADLPSNYEKFTRFYNDHPRVHVWKDGAEVVRRADFIIYSVETENISKVVEMYGKCTKVGSIVAGQTSVKKPEIEAFEKHLPQDTQIITLHSLHGPNVQPVNQPLVLIRYRATDESYSIVKQVVQTLGSEIVELTWKEHDAITADTQAVTHLAFLSMGSAWKSTGIFPWLNETYKGGIENAKVMMTLRIYSSKWHVYAGLAIMNPDARSQVSQYTKSVSELFKMMIQERQDEFQNRIQSAANFVFGGRAESTLLLDDKWLDDFSLFSVPSAGRKPNSHLSLLAIVDSWFHLGINPYHHMICQTPPFRLWLGITEYLFKSPLLLTSSINAALFDKSIRADDLEFVNATQAWSQTILLGSMDGYKEKFLETSAFFSDRLEEGKSISSQMLNVITSKKTHN